MSLKIYDELEQGSPEWLEARRGILTASVIGQLITPKTIKSAANDSSRSLIAQLVAERVTGFVDDSYSGGAMERGSLDEPYARAYYDEHYAPVDEVGFVVREEPTYRVGYSPDGLIQSDGLLEIKSRMPKIHLKTILADEVPLEYVAQCQMGLFTTGRSWIDFMSYCGGMPPFVKRMTPDPRWQEAILETVEQFEHTAAAMTSAYREAVTGLPIAPRIDHFAEMSLP